MSAPQFLDPATAGAMIDETLRAYGVPPAYIIPAPEQPAAAPVAEVVPATVTAEANSLLDQLGVRYLALKALIDQLTEESDVINARMKLELLAAAPGSEDVTVIGASMPQALRLVAIHGFRVAAKKMKAEDPETYAKWSTPYTQWHLQRVKA